MEQRRTTKRLSRVAAFLSVAAAVPAPAIAGAPVQEIPLRAGDVVFADGARGLAEPLVVAPHPLLDPMFCAGGHQGCFDYHLKVLEPAERLRVGVDTRRGGFQVYLYDPDGKEVMNEIPPFNADLAVEDPAAGTWNLRVVHVAQANAAFRIRARLDGTETGAPPAGKRALLPNLRMQPPFDFTLETPGSATGLFDNPHTRGLAPTRGCLPTEIVTFAARRCLRFSTGPENVGTGRLQLVFEPDDDQQPLKGHAYQLVDRSDGVPERREAGDYIYHAEHAHFHHAGFAGFQLLRVTDEKRGGLVAAGTGPKQGFCMADIRIADWFAFDNVLDSTERTNCSGLGDDPTAEMRTGVGVGWADIYAYYQEGMFVDIGENPDGLYVVRVRANDRDTIHETTSRDNISYAYLEIKSGDVTVRERGYGEDPWDPRKRVANDLAPMTAGH